MPLKIAELFTGTGAFTFAFENFEEFESVFANDIEPNSKKIYDLNYDTQLTLSDIHNIKNEDIPKMDIITGGFPCFVAGTKVLTNNGYKDIENVLHSDKLLTHNGNFNKIVNIQRKEYTGKLYNISIKYHPEKIICTEDHPFYTRTRLKKWNNEKRIYEYNFENPTWKNAKELTVNDYYGMVINQNSIIPEFTFEKKNIKLDNLDMWCKLGYFVGDNTNNTNKTFEDDNFFWNNVLKTFIKSDNNKMIPNWVQDAPKEYIQEFIRGYLKSYNNLIQKPNISSDLEYGLQRLYFKIGSIKEKLEDNDSSSFIEGNYVWLAPSEIEIINSWPEEPGVKVDPVFCKKIREFVRALVVRTVRSPPTSLELPDVSVESVIFPPRVASPTTERADTSNPTGP
jgi:hypothetical protein